MGSRLWNRRWSRACACRARRNKSASTGNTHDHVIYRWLLLNRGVRCDISPTIQALSRSLSAVATHKSVHKRRVMAAQGHAWRRLSITLAHLGTPPAVSTYACSNSDGNEGPSYSHHDYSAEMVEGLVEQLRTDGWVVLPDCIQPELAVSLPHEGSSHPSDRRAHRR
eukprot:COSAG02_NODE_5008_length_4726_cov_3.358764_2_plen_167_part_00